MFKDSPAGQTNYDVEAEGRGRAANVYVEKWWADHHDNLTRQAVSRLWKAAQAEMQVEIDGLRAAARYWKDKHDERIAKLEASLREQHQNQLDLLEQRAELEAANLELAANVELSGDQRRKGKL